MNKQNSCTEKSICGYCKKWQYNKCYGNFERFIKNNEGNVLVGYDIRYLQNKFEIYIGVCRKMEKLGYITRDQLLETLSNKFKPDLTKGTLERRIKYYVSLGLLEPPIKEAIPGVSGSVSWYKDDSAKLFKVIEDLKNSYYAIKPEKIKYWIDLLKLDEEAVKEIKKIIKEYIEFKRDIGLKFGISMKTREFLMKKVPLRLWDYKNLLTKFDILKRVFSERATEELDIEYLMSLWFDKRWGYPENPNAEWTSDIGELLDEPESSTTSPVDIALCNPEMEIDLDIPEIKVSFREPISRTVIFRENKIEILNI